MNNNQMPNNRRPATGGRTNTGRVTPPQKRPNASGGTNQGKPVRRAEPPRTKLTAEQIEINRANRRREKYYLKKRRAAALHTFLVRLGVFAVAFVILSLLFAGIFYLNLTSNDAESASRYSYTIGDKKYSLPYESAVRDGRVYINFNEIADLCGLAVTGTPEDMKFIVKGDDTETIRFVGDSRAVYVNGIETRLGSESYVSEGNIFVPLDFVSAYLEGIAIDLDENSNKVTVSRIITNLDEKGKLPKGTEPVYSELSFLLKSPLGLEPLEADEESMGELPDMGFLTNMSFYEEFMNPGNTDEFLFIVSREHMLTSDYVPQDLAEVKDTRKETGRPTQLMRLNAAMALEAMFREMRAAGFEDVSVTSAYRSYSFQESLYNGYIKQYGEDYAKTISMPAGASEHQSGLCADLHNLPAADKAFAQEPVYEWLRTNCWKFGFILRYPEDKMEITLIDFEPWHYRYVGRYHAKNMYDMNYCLEEYMDYISTGE